jgi:hypothetical protein
LLWAEALLAAETAASDIEMIRTFRIVALPLETRIAPAGL